MVKQEPRRWPPGPRAVNKQPVGWLDSVWSNSILDFWSSGCFLIPYLICLVLAGVPILILEVSLGQFQGQGGITAWKICPLFQGIVILYFAFHLLTVYGAFIYHLPRCGVKTMWADSTLRCHSITMDKPIYTYHSPNITSWSVSAYNELWRITEQMSKHMTNRITSHKGEMNFYLKHL